MRLVIILIVLFCTLSAEMQKNDKIYIAGHKGLVGSSLLNLLINDGYTNIITCNSNEVDLRRQQEVEAFFQKNSPEYVFLIAAKVGGINANMKYPASFIYDNLSIELNVINAAHKFGVKKLLFLGSSCIYPRSCPQPMKEEYLLTGILEPTNEYYALAKISGIKLGQAYNIQYPNSTKFISCLPCNLYGLNDNWDLNSSHVIPALIQKIAQAKEEKAPFVKLWGSGKARREFLHSDDLAQACLYLMLNYESNEIINVGAGNDITIKDLALKIQNILAYDGEIIFDTTFPDGMPQKLLDIQKIEQMGWKPKITLDNGLIEVINAKFKN